MVAPSTAGTYTPEYMMVWELHQWFGDRVSATVQVTAPSVDADVVSTTIPATMTAGQSYPVTVTMKNTGTMTWTSADNIRMGYVSADSAKFGGSGRFFLPSGTSVAPNEEYTFAFTMVAPSTAGSYTPEYMMVWELHQWFGDRVSQSVQVII
jgi:hypothetical protein